MDEAKVVETRWYSTGLGVLLRSQMESKNRIRDEWIAKGLSEPSHLPRIKRELELTHIDYISIERG